MLQPSVPLLSLALLACASPSARSQVGAEEVRTLNGPHDQARFGSSVAVLGDLDGDGRPELLVGAPGVRGVGRRSGEATVHKGADGAVLWRMQGEGAWSELGSSVAAVGDVDQDGCPDFAVGACFDGEGNSREGSAVVYSGRTGRPLRVYFGEAPREAAGTALCALGDLDGDGISELAVGAPGWSRDGFRCGIVRIYSLGSGELLHAIQGVAADGLCGTALAQAGDVDRDGRPDLMVGAPAEGAGGVVRVYSGADASLLLVLVGEQERADFGAAMGSLGDLDGDGVPELAVGAPGFDGGSENSGRVSIHSGASGALLASHLGGRENARAGASLAAVADLDHDGKADLVIGGRTGCVQLVSGASLARLALVSGSSEGPSFGAALAVGALGDGPPQLAIGAPETTFGGPMAGRVRVFTLAGSSAPADGPVAAETAPAAAPVPSPVEPDFLRAVLPERFHRTEALDRRWIFYSTMSTAEARGAVALIERAYGRLDEVLGSPGLGADAATPAPVILSFVSSLDDQLLIAAEIGRRFPELRDWTEQWGGLPQMTLWHPLLSVVRHDQSTALVKRPEIQVIHHLVHLELVRRYGAIPGWVAEAISYGLQDEITGQIYAYSNRGWEQLADEYHDAWREQTSDLWTGSLPPVLDQLFGGRHEAFQQPQAYGRFGLGLYWLKDPERRLPRLLQGLSALRPEGTQPQTDFQPPAPAQLELLVEVYGGDLRPRVGAFWSSISLAGGPRARREAAVNSIETAIAELGLEVHLSRDGRLRVVSDASKKQAAEVLKSTGAVLARLEKVFGKQWPDGAPALTLFMLKDHEAYRRVCDGIAKASPGVGGYLAEAREGVGFLLPHLPVAAYWNDIKFQEQTRPAQSVGHQAAHLWLRTRYGQLPLWLSEGIACAVEQAEFGSVWANWNLQGFVYDSYRDAWPSTARELLTTKKETVRCYDWTGLAYGSEPPMVERPVPGLEQVYGYRATVFRDELAHLAFAFASYGMEGDKAGMVRLLTALQEEYQANWVTVGRFEPGAALMTELAARAFGADFPAKLAAWWAKRR